LNAKSALKPGMQLVVYPKGGKQSGKSMVYQVRRGDSISSIAARFQVAINDVMRWNQLDKGDYLKPGQEITLFVKNNS
ncbi:MAG: LysM peptidoglycan-binding domain-containing protein, partial [Aeromonas jandaei]